MVRRFLLASLFGFAVLASAHQASAQIVKTAGQDVNANIGQDATLTVKTPLAGTWNLVVLINNVNNTLVLNAMSNAPYGLQVAGDKTNLTDWDGTIYGATALFNTIQVDSNGTPTNLTTTNAPLNGAAANTATIAAGRDHTIRFSQLVDYGDPRLPTGHTYKATLTFTLTAALI